MLNHLRADLAIIRERDPAARGPIEILLCYPGFQAVTLHRLSKLKNITFERFAHKHECTGQTSLRPGRGLPRPRAKTPREGTPQGEAQKARFLQLVAKA